MNKWSNYGKWRHPEKRKELMNRNDWNKEDILISVYNMIYEQDTTNKKKCLLLAEEITEIIEEIIEYKKLTKQQEQ